MSIPSRLRARDYSVNRYYVDQFYDEQLRRVQPDAKVLDIGGHRKRKVGEFDISRFCEHVEYVNIDPRTEPDYLCDAASIPVPDGDYDVVLLSEVLEHLRDPVSALTEAHRVLRPGGKLLATTPFMYHQHADPFDYARYAESWYRETLAAVGFTNVLVEPRGLFFSTLANQVKLWSRCTSSRIEAFVLRRFAYYLIGRALRVERTEAVRSHWFFGNNVLAFSVIAEAGS